MLDHSRGCRGSIEVPKIRQKEEMKIETRGEGGDQESETKKGEEMVK